jgi:DNA-dependent metalloprotease WSS1
MSRSVSTELEPLVNNFEHLSDKRRAAEALQTLRKIASLVKPLMRQRNWRVGTLAEFYPPENNLLGLNINAGQKICLRLRHAGDENQFLPVESVVDTMLHELAHNVHGPHNQHFHALWDKLRDEHQALVMKGYTGEGFLSNGNRLGGRRMPINEMRRQARAAAEKRKVTQQGSGQRLGGAGIMRGQDARSVIAAAVERRQRIERGCATDTNDDRLIAREAARSANVTRTMVEQEDEDEATMMQAYIDLIQEDEQQEMGDAYIPSSQENPAGSKSLPKEPEPNAKLVQQQREIEESILRRKQNQAKPTQAPVKRSREPTPPRSNLEPQDVPDTWTCEICTLVNPINFLTCDACTVERPAHISASIQSSFSPSEPASNGRTGPVGRPSTSTKVDRPAAFAPKNNAYDNLKRFEAQAVSKRDQSPMGWVCHSCGTFMESQWWTCSSCGSMKAAS